MVPRREAMLSDLACRYRAIRGCRRRRLRRHRDGMGRLLTLDRQR
jgi:hypothetical protein